MPRGRRRCDTCGAPVAERREITRAASVEPMQPGPVGRAESLRSCPRCAYAGEGIPYFSRGTHMAGLVGITVLTAGAMGVGGLAYYLVRKDHRVCPRCGRAWGHRGERALVRRQDSPVSIPDRRREARQRGFSLLMFLLAAVLTVGGVVQAEVAMVLAAGLAAGAGLYLNRSADREREARREALLSALQLPVLKLAAARGGRLTVTEVAAEMGWPMARAEKVLRSLDDGFRVSSEVTDEGLIVYEFPELLFSSDRQLPPESTA